MSFSFRRSTLWLRSFSPLYWRKRPFYFQALPYFSFIFSSSSNLNHSCIFRIYRPIIPASAGMGAAIGVVMFATKLTSANAPASVLSSLFELSFLFKLRFIYAILGAKNFKHAASYSLATTARSSKAFGNRIVLLTLHNVLLIA